MRWQPFQVVGGSYSDDAKPWSVQDTVNYIPVAAERTGTRSPGILRCAPGFIVFADLGSKAPIRGLHNVEGLLLAVSGQTLYKISADGTPTSIGTIPGVGRVSMAHNQITGGNQVAIANGQSGYVYNTVDGTLVQITDDAFPGAISFDYIDSYITGVEPGRRFAFTSDLAAATSYNTLDREEAEGSPDKLVGQIVTHREWWLFGERTIEPYVDTGAGTGTFQRAGGTVLEVGLAGTFAAAKMDNTVYWLGNDGIVYRANGYSPERVSTHAIEEDISRSNMAEAFAFTYEDRGHKVFYLTFPDGHTWGYDAASGEWHRRQSKGLDRWRLNNLVRWNGYWIGGDYSNGLVYVLDWGVQSENGDELERSRTTAVVQDAQNALIVDALALVMTTGRGQTCDFPFKASGHLPDKRSGLPQTYKYAISGYVPSTSVRLYSGTFPAGLTFDDSGNVSGTRTTPGTYTWTLAFEDATGREVLVADSDTTGAVYSWSFVLGDNLPTEIGATQNPSLDVANDLVLGGGVDAKVYTSPDGKAWTAIGSTFPVSLLHVYSAKATTNSWIANGPVSGIVNYVRTKDKGTTWTQLTPTGYPYFATYGTSVLLVKDGVVNVSSDEGDTFNPVTVASGIFTSSGAANFSFLYIPEWDQWILPGIGKILSGDGVAPTSFSDEGVTTTTTSSGPSFACYSPTLDALVVGGPTDRFYVKTGKTGTWQTVTFSEGSFNVFEMAWEPTLALFVGNKQDRVMLSADGLSWSSSSIFVSGSPVTVGGNKGCLYMPWADQLMLSHSTNANHNMLVSDI